ncbi:flagellar hook-basal body protein [Nitrosophilus alvini]|uniref:flagellar hook-basal body protein n=1 Tax=Nitrosophilus alvini TaxID=2714855 RepID=UPI0019094728|nr:flagellar hook basal-body protein [Nitrosophilus alvini]
MALNIQSLYVLATGSARAMEQADTTANNIANVNTPGFKKLLLKEMSQRIPQNGGDTNHLFVFSRFEDTPVITEQGALKKTENRLDFAIEGSGFFVVKAGNEEMLTRNGHFFLNEEGYLIDAKENFVLNEEGENIQLELKGEFTVTEDGTLFQKGEVISKIAVRNYDGVEAVGDSYYRPKGEETEADFKMLQGFLEGSNVNALTEMTNLITAQRRFGIYATLMKSLDALEQKTNEIGRA